MRRHQSAIPITGQPPINSGNFRKTHAPSLDTRADGRTRLPRRNFISPSRVPMTFAHRLLREVGTHAAPTQGEVVLLPTKARFARTITASPYQSAKIPHRQAAKETVSGLHDSWATNPHGSTSLCRWDSGSRKRATLSVLSPRCHTRAEAAGTLLLVSWYGTIITLVGITCQARKTSAKPFFGRYFRCRRPVARLNFYPLTTLALSLKHIRRNGYDYIILITDRFSRYAAMHPVHVEEFTAAGTVRILVPDYINIWGFPKQLRTDKGLQLCADLSKEICDLNGIKKLCLSPMYQNRNGGTECLNHTMTQKLSVVVNERPNDWDERLPFVQSAYNSSDSDDTGLAPDEVYLGRFPAYHLPFSNDLGSADTKTSTASNGPMVT